jgi:hypothetical protein
MLAVAVFAAGVFSDENAQIGIAKDVKIAINKSTMGTRRTYFIRDKLTHSSQLLS